MYLLIAPSSDPSAHCFLSSLTQLFGIHVSSHFSSSGFVQPASLQSNSDDLHVDVDTKENFRLWGRSQKLEFRQELTFAFYKLG